MSVPSVRTRRGKNGVAPKHDEPVQRTAVPPLLVLVQTAPTFEVLATSHDRDKIEALFRDLVTAWVIRQDTRVFAWFVRGATYLD